MEAASRPGLHFQVDREYARCVSLLRRAGVIEALPKASTSGVIGIHGQEYPIPTRGHVLDAFTRCADLVDWKGRQGFARLQLTPIGIPASRLLDLTRDVVLRHAAVGGVALTKQDPTDAEVSARLNADKPLWVWDKVREALDTASLVYFPRAFADSDPHGLTKAEVIRDTRLCAVPGWSIGLVEPIAIMPRKGEGAAIGGRRQLEAGSTPQDYLQILATSTYEHETGWTLEDFLTHFISQLEETGQVSHDRYDGNALWLLGSYLPDAGPGLRKLVPVGYWARVSGRMEVSAHRSANRLRGWVARSMVRLGA